MIANFVKTLAQVITGSSSDTTSRRRDRRYPLGLGLEGMELRIAPAAIAPILVTVTNEPTTTTPTAPTGSTSTTTAQIPASTSMIA